MQNGAVLGSTGRRVLRAQLRNGAAVPKQIEPNEVVHERCSACSDDSALGKPCSLQPITRRNGHCSLQPITRRNGHCSLQPTRDGTVTAAALQFTSFVGFGGTLFVW